MFQDARYALRQVRKSRAISGLVVLTMALGIGANSLVYSVLTSTVLNPMPFENADRLVYIWAQHPTNSWWVTPQMEDVVHWRETVDGLERIETLRGRTFTVTGLEEPVRVHGVQLGSGLFEMLGAQPRQGRLFSAEENLGTGDRVAVVSHQFWRGQLGGVENVLGQTLELDGVPHVIVGVMPADFRLQSPFALAQIWTPLVESEIERSISTIGLLRPGVTLDQVNQDIAANSLTTSTTLEGWVGRARRPTAFLSGQYTSTVWALQGAVGLVLLIATANVVNLLLARGSVRQQEMAVRAAIGGSRGRLVRQLLTETMLLTVAGGTIGWALAAGGVQLLDTLRPAELNDLATLRLDSSVTVATFAATVVAGLVAGLLPALQGAGGNLHAQMAALGGRTSDGDSRRRARNALVVTEVALSTILVVTAGLLVSSFLYLQRVDPGFSTDNLLTMRVSVSDARFEDDGASVEVFWEELVRAVRTALGPNAEAVTLSVGVPPQLGVEFGAPTRADGVTPELNSEITAASWVMPEYFETFGMEWLAGTTFAEQTSDEIPVVIDTQFAQQVWPGEQALGRRIRFGGGDEDPWRRVVGIVANVKAFGLMSGEEHRQMYYPLNGGDNLSTFGKGSLMLSVRTAGKPLEAAATIRRAIWNVEPDAPITELSTMRERLADTIALPRFNAFLMTGLALVGLGLSLVGVYGVLSYSVARRTHELGVRMALGASRRSVLRLVGRTSFGLVGAGVALGVAGGVAASRLLGTLLHGVQPTDPSAYGAAALALVAVGVVATWLPAARATRVDPAVALRNE